jgi:hypothetical protein
LVGLILFVVVADRGCLAFVLQHRHIIVVPQNVTLEDIVMTREFVEGHIFTENPASPSQLCSLSGIRVVLSDAQDSVSVLAGPPSDAERFSFFSDTAAVFGPRSVFAHPPTRPLSVVHILRVTALELNSVNVPMVLVSDPISFPDAHWSRRGGTALAHSQSTVELAERQAAVTHAAAAELRAETMHEDAPAPALQHVNIHEFMDRLKDPRAADVARRLKMFIAQFLSPDARSPDALAQQARDFMDHLEMEVRTSLGHARVRSLTAHSWLRTSCGARQARGQCRRPVRVWKST